MASKARQSFDDNSKDIKRLLTAWHEFEGIAKEIPEEGDEIEIPATRTVFLKSIIVLLVSYWEAYLEDIAGEALKHIIQNINDANELPKELKKPSPKSLKKNLMN